MSAITEFVLSGQLIGHSADVRAVCAVSCSLIATGSRDSTLVLWSVDEETNTWSAEATLAGHEGHVAALLALPPGPSLPAGGLVSAAYDHSVFVWDLGARVPVARLLGHSNNVCALCLGPRGEIVSGGWDARAVVWAAGATADGHGPMTARSAVLEGHDGSVLALVGDARNDVVVTGGADKTLRVWKSAAPGSWACAAVLRGHRDAVRGLALVGDSGSLVASAANDTYVKVWDVGAGTCVHTFSGHSNLVFTLAALLPRTTFDAPEPVLVSGSEDKSVMVWHASGFQRIAYPSTVWAVDALPNGDIVVGSADGMARVFTRDAARAADAAQAAAFADYAASAALLSSGQQVNLDELADVSEVPSTVGKADGETRLFRDGSKAVAYSWSASSGMWMLIGDVVGAPGGKEELNGEFYDVVFEVDTGDGRGNLKLGYNHGEEPSAAAARFCAQHSLHPQFIQQVSDFIRKNAPPPTIDMADEHGSTGAWSRISIASKYFPVATPTYFSATKGVAGALAKLVSTPLPDTVDTAALAALADTLAVPAKYHSSFVAPEHVAALFAAIDAAPDATKFAGYDLLRLVLLHKDGARAAAANPRAVVDLVLAGLDTAASPLLRLLALRVAVNAFKAPSLRAALIDAASELLTAAAPVLRADPPVDRDAVAALQLVLAYATVGGSLGRDAVVACSAAVAAALATANDTLVYRALVAYGTLLVNAPAHTAAVAADLGLGTDIDAYASDSADIAAICADIRAFLNAQA